ncbi:MAG: LytTR family DNA-binding domain-containing protein, partial [Bacteroidales bacterium]|nr:LytTR family DNA-binding domain-containing protein [Bacteroidales bacterium]
MIRGIIVEDEIRSRDTLLGLLSRYCKNVEIIAEADSYRSGLAAIREQHPDVVFLDIQMPDGSGFKLLEELDEIKFEIIFTTAFDQFAIKAIKYSALDYLLKPIDPEELVSALKKVENKISKIGVNENIQVLLDNIKSHDANPHKIVLSTFEKIHIIETDNILRCESDNYYTNFFLTDGKQILISKTLKENEAMLGEHNFIRPHKSHLVNVKYIKGFLKNDGGYIEMTDGTHIPVSRRKREKIIE